MISKKKCLHYHVLISLMILVFFVLPSAAFALLDVGTPDSDIGSLKQGIRFLGMNVSLSEKESENPSSLFQQIESVDRVQYDINAFGGYFIKDMFALGGKLNYRFSEKDSGYSGDSDTTRIQSVSRFTSLGFLMRNYLPIDKSGRFSLFVETGVDVGYGKEIVQTTLIDDMDRKVTESYILDIGVTPGIMAFINKGVAIEASVNIMGLTAQWGDYDFNNGERTGGSSSVDLDFTIKLLTLFIGITCYF